MWVQCACFHSFHRCKYTLLCVGVWLLPFDHMLVRCIHSNAWTRTPPILAALECSFVWVAAMDLSIPGLTGTCDPCAWTVVGSVALCVSVRLLMSLCMCISVGINPGAWLLCFVLCIYSTWVGAAQHSSKWSCPLTPSALHPDPPSRLLPSIAGVFLGGSSCGFSLHISDTNAVGNIFIRFWSFGYPFFLHVYLNIFSHFLIKKNGLIKKNLGWLSFFTKQ